MAVKRKARSKSLPIARVRQRVDKFRDVWSEWTPAVLSLLRIASGLLIMHFGSAKILKFPHNPSYDGLQPFSLIWFAGMIELIFGALLTAGFLTRWAAFVLSGLMAFAYFIAHAPRNFIPMFNNGSLAALFCFVFFYIAFAGAGPWSVDAALKRR